MDGVLWRGTQEIGDLSAIFDIFSQRGLRVVLATNNATLSVDKFLEKLRSFEVEIEPWQIVTSAGATARYLSKLFPGGGPLYIVGEEGLVGALQEAGFFHQPGAAQAVVAGLDRQTTYQKLCEASLLIQTGIPFI